MTTVTTVDTMDRPFDELEAARSHQPFTLRTLEEIERIIAGVARSIEALDDGTYGTCEECSVALRPEALAADPLAIRCDAHLVRERPSLFLGTDVSPATPAAAATASATDENSEIVHDVAPDSTESTESTDSTDSTDSTY